MCELCELDKGDDGFIITICRTCGIPLVVARHHGQDFTESEKRIINRMFLNRPKRWEQRSITDHAHVHLLD